MINFADNKGRATMTDNTTRQDVLRVDYQSRLNYAMWLNGQQTLKGVEVENLTDSDWHNVCVTLSGEMLVEQQEHIDLSKSRITIIGVNKLTSDILKFLKNKGARLVFLANRSQIKAHALADPLGIEVYQLHDKQRFLADTDILISTTSAPHALIQADDLPVNKSLLAIDLAFPRDIAPSVGRLPNVTLYNIRDVEQRVRKNISVRQSEIAHAEAIIEEEIAELQDILRRRKLRTKEEVRWKKDEGQKMKDVI